MMMLTYEQLLDRNLDWALREGSMHFEKESAVHKTLRRITCRLDELGIPYALAGAMALFFHGFRRFTEDVDLLVTPEGLGYVPPFAGSKQLRDAETGVRVEFLVTGDYPGDGKPKPVALPDPSQARIEKEGLWCLDLPQLIELKLASGMTNPARLMPEDLADQLNPYVRDKYRELWTAVRDNPEA
jgi:hypothetical protein